MELDGIKYGWPRVHASCDYRLPLRFEEEVDITLTIKEKKNKSLTYAFRFTKTVGEEIKEAARGVLTVVCVTVDSETGRMKSIPIPESIAAQIEASDQ